MKIRDTHFQRENKQQVKIELLDLLNQPSDKQERPCPGCRLTFPNDPSVTSTRHCAFNCPEAPEQMSSDPQRHPIEINAVPLVYAFYTLRLLMPCWSCEGHLDDTQRVYKLPKLWFYSVSPFYVKLVSQSIEDLKIKKLINNDWMIRILPFSQSMFTMTYSLEPTPLEGQTRHDLASLHADMLVIAKNIRRGVFNFAKDYIVRIDKSPYETASKHTT